MGGERKRTKLETLDLIIQIWESANQNSIETAHLGPLVGKDPAILQAYYEGQKHAFKLVREYIEKIEKDIVKL